jgi:hypothetical protein
VTAPDLVLAQWAAGMAAALFVVGLWRVTSPGYAWTVSAVAALLALGAWQVGGATVTALPVLAAVVAAGLAASMLLRVRHRWSDALFHGLAAVAGAVAVVQIAAADPGAAGVPVAVLRGFTGALFLGAVTDAMILGHWYLIDPKLPKSAIRRLNVIAAGTLALDAVAVVVPPQSIVSTLSTGRVLYLVAWIGLCTFTGVLIWLVSRALRVAGYASVMSATGLLYVATMSCFAAVVVARLAVTP